MSHLRNIALVLTLALVFSVPNAANAQTNASLQAQIQALLAKLSELQAQVTSLEGTSGNTSPLISEKGESSFVEPLSTNADVTTVNPISGSYGTFTIKYDVTAVDVDLYIPRTASDTGGSGATYSISGSTFNGQKTAVLTSTADTARNNHFVVREGDTETFSLTVALDPNTTGNYGVGLTKVGFALSPTASSATNGSIVLDSSNKDFRTKLVTIRSSSTTETVGNLSMTFKGSALPKILGITKPLAQSICVLVSARDGSCSWNGERIEAVGSKDGGPAIRILKPAPNASMERGGLYAISFTDSSSVKAGGNYRAYGVHYPSLSSSADAIYELHTPTTETTAGTHYLKWDFLFNEVGGSSRAVPSGNYYIAVVNLDTGVIGSTGAFVYLKDSVTTTTDTYRGYMNDRMFIETKNITEAAALENCKLNASSNPNSSIYCMWGTKEIYRKGITVSSKPSCSITSNKSSVQKLEAFVVSWSGKNADYATNKFGDKLDVTGYDSVAVGTAGAYEYPVTFYGKGGTKVCTARVTILEAPTPTGSIDDSSLYAYSGNPTISGVAKNASTVGISISNGDKVYGSGDLTVRDGRWSVTVSPALAPGKYTVSLSTYNNEYRRSDTLDAGSLIIEDTTEPLVSPGTTNTKGVSPETLGASAVVGADAALSALAAQLKVLVEKWRALKP